MNRAGDDGPSPLLVQFNQKTIFPYSHPPPPPLNWPHPSRLSLYAPSAWYAVCWSCPTRLKMMIQGATKYYLIYKYPKAYFRKTWKENWILGQTRKFYSLPLKHDNHYHWVDVPERFFGTKKNPNYMQHVSLTKVFREMVDIYNYTFIQKMSHLKKLILEILI